MFDPDREETLEEFEEEGYETYPTSTDYESGDIEEFVGDYEDVNEDFDGDGEMHILAGRITRYNHLGGLCFLDITESDESVQVQLDADTTTDYELVEKFQVGDVIEVTGEAIRTNTGQLSLYAEGFRLLSKTLRGDSVSEVLMKDLDVDRKGISEEDKIRQRGMSLQWNDDLFESVRTRYQVINSIRSYLNSDGYMEVDTPVLHSVSGGGQAQPFTTRSSALEQDLYLRIAPELYLKRLIIGGFSKVYEMAHVFRNEDIDSSHHPEFTMVELYHAYSDMAEMMELTERMISDIVHSITGSHSVMYGDVELDFTPPWKVLTMEEGINQYGELPEPLAELSDEDVIEIASQFNDVSTRGDAIMELYDEWVEGELIQPTFVVEFPPESTPLCKEHPDKEDILDRFELVVNGTEIANSYSEQNNPLEQKEAFEAQVERYSEGSEEYQDIDTKFLQDLAMAMPPTGGLGIGVDRLSMICANEQSIKNVYPFPLTRTK